MRILVVHLRMTGRLLHEAAEAAPPGRDPHVHAVLHLDDGSRVVFRDVRKFGRFYVADAGDPGVPPGAWRPVAGCRLPPGLAILGPEPGALSERRFRGVLAGRRARIKALLLDQEVIAGVGNLYADEALFRARLHPARRACDLRPAEAARLWRALRQLLSEAVDARGTTFSDYRDGLGEPGAFAARLRVFRRTGEPCPSCGERIRRVAVAGRSSHFCPRCQPEDPGGTAGRPAPLEDPRRRPEQPRRPAGRSKQARGPSLHPEPARKLARPSRWNGPGPGRARPAAVRSAWKRPPGSDGKERSR